VIQQLKVLKKTEDWLLSVHPCLKNFPKSERFTLAQRIENGALECIEWILFANLDKPNRPAHLMRARVGIERVQVLIRLAHSLSFLDVSRYERFSESLAEISKMLAGWARAR
jgi:hypothetical protein